MKKGSIIRDALVLFAITLVAAVLLGVTYEITKEPIAVATQAAKEEAYGKVLKGFVKTGEADAQILNGIREAVSDMDEFEGSEITEMLAAYADDGECVGYVMTVVNHNGYGGDIGIAMGVSSDMTLGGIEFLELSETAGLGMKAKDEAFKSQFDNARTESFGLAKAGIEGEQELDAISSATITSKAVTRAVNAGLYAADVMIAQTTLKGGI